MRVKRYTAEAVVATSSSLASLGVRLSLTHFGIPLMLVPKERGQVQAFVNGCCHRGPRMAPEGRGSACVCLPVSRVDLPTG